MKATQFKLPNGHVVRVGNRLPSSIGGYYVALLGEVPFHDDRFLHNDGHLALGMREGKWHETYTDALRAVVTYLRQPMREYYANTEV